MKQLTITFVTFGVALLLWAGGLAASQYLSDEPARKMKEKAHSHDGVIAGGGVTEGGIAGSGMRAGSNQNTPSAKVSPKGPSLGALEAEYLKDTKNIDTAVSYANALFEEGISEGNAESLKKSVGLYHEILEQKSDQPDALLGLGTLSLHVGVADKAKEYYQKYLEGNPGDNSVAANLALAEARGGDSAAALKRLDEILKNNEDFVIALVTKGLVLTEMGEVKEARKVWLRAEELEPNPVLKSRISSLITGSVRKETEEGSGKLPVAESEVDSSKEGVPKGLVTFFKSHDIVGPKFIRAVLLEAGVVAIEVMNFPVEAMPPFAREKFEARLKDQLNAYGQKEIVIRDVTSGADLLRVQRES